MSLTDDFDFSELIRKLHSTFDLKVHTEPCGDVIKWTAVLSGEDFLNGHWKATRTGYAKTTQKAFKAASNATKKNPWTRVYNEGGKRDDE
jgi:hypothetical protein